MAGQDYTNWGSNIKWQGNTTPGKGGAGALSGAATGAQIGSLFGPVGTGVGAGIGAFGGWLMGRRPQQLSDAEQHVQNWDKLRNEGLKEFGGKALGGAWQGIQDFSSAVNEARNQPLPGMSELYGGIGKAEGRIGQMAAYQPKRIDQNLGEERANLSTIGNRASQAAMPIFAQADAEKRLLAGNANMTAAQKAHVGGQASRQAAQAAGAQGVQLEEGARGRIATLSQAGDQLVQRSLEAAMQGQVSLTQAYAQAAQLGQAGQQYFLSALQAIPGMYERFLGELAPGNAQYGAAAQGGKGTDWMSKIGDLAKTGVQAYQMYKGGKPVGAGGDGSYTSMGGNMTGSMRS